MPDTALGQTRAAEQLSGELGWGLLCRRDGHLRPAGGAPPSRGTRIYVACAFIAIGPRSSLAQTRASTSPPDAGASRIPASGRHDDPAKQQSPRRRLSVLPRTKTSSPRPRPAGCRSVGPAITRAAPTRRSPLVRCGHVVATRRRVAFLRASSAPAAATSCRGAQVIAIVAKQARCRHRPTRPPSPTRS